MFYLIFRDFALPGVRGFDHPLTFIKYVDTVLPISIILPKLQDLLICWPQYLLQHYHQTISILQ